MGNTMKNEGKSGNRQKSLAHDKANNSQSCQPHVQTPSKGVQIKLCRKCNNKLTSSEPKSVPVSSQKLHISKHFSPVL